MKSTITLILVIALAITSIFATNRDNNITIGITSGYEQSIIRKDLNDTAFDTVPVKMLGLFDITSNFSIGANIGLDIMLPIANHTNHTSYGFAADVLAYYTKPISDVFDFYVGGGLEYDYINICDNTAINSLALMMDTKISFNIIDNIEIISGTSLGIDVLKSLTRNDNTRMLLKDNIGMEWALNIGCAYTFS